MAYGEEPLSFVGSAKLDDSPMKSLRGFVAQFISKRRREVMRGTGKKRCACKLRAWKSRACS